MRLAFMPGQGLVVALATVVSTLLCGLVLWHRDREDTRGTMGRRLRQYKAMADELQSPRQLLEALTGSALFHAWDWSSPIGTAPSAGCKWAPLTPPGAYINSTICLHAGDDLLADTIRRRGYWPECADLPAMLRHSASVQGGDGSPLFVDIGANIGACTLHMLLTASDASVLAFEPGPHNLFYTSSSLRQLQMGVMPRLAQRAVLLPLGLGETASTASLYQAVRAHSPES